VTVSDVLDAYETAAKQETSAKLAKARVSALREVRAHFGPLAPEAISPSYVEEYVTKRRKEVSKRTVSIELAWFRSALRRALKAETITAAPRITLPQAKAKARRRVLSRAEMARLLEALNGPQTPLHVAGFVALSIYTGQRSIHVKALQWRDVDLDEGMLYFTRSNPKAAENKQTEDVPIAKALLPYLERLRKAARTDFVIEWEDAPVASLKRSWASLLKRANITDLRIHDLRRSFATFAATAGASLSDVAALMNLDEDTLRRHYSHGSPIGRHIIEKIGGGDA
jgi:integrase